MAAQPDQVWALDFQVDVTADGRQLRSCNVVDEFTREALATAGARSFTTDDTTILLDKIIAETGRRPVHPRMDNGPEFTTATGASSVGDVNMKARASWQHVQGLFLPSYPTGWKDRLNLGHRPQRSADSVGELPGVNRGEHVQSTLHVTFAPTDNLRIGTIMFAFLTAPKWSQDHPTPKGQ